MQQNRKVMKTWDELTLPEQAAMMKVAVKNGIYDLPTIRAKYNEFAEGGSTDADVVDRIIKEEGFNTKPEDIGDGKITLGSGLTAKKWHDLYKQRGNKWSAADNRMAVAEEVANRRKWAERNIPNWFKLPDSSQKALLSYKYNYDFNRNNSPKLFAALEAGNLQEAARQIDATSKDPKFKKGLQARRQREQNWFLSDVTSKPTVPTIPFEQPVSTAVFNPYVQQVENTTIAPVMVPDENSYVTAHRLTEAEERKQKFQERMEAISNFNRLMQLTSLDNTAVPAFMPTTGNTFLDSMMKLTKAEGGKIEKENTDIIPFTQKREVIITPDKQYNRYLNTLPDNQRFTSNDKYDSYQYWKLNGKPKNFTEAYNKGMFHYDHSDNGYHANSIAFDDNTGIGYFMKPKTHDTVGYELDWFNKGLVSEEGGWQRPETFLEWKESQPFRNSHILIDDPNRPNYYKYQPIEKANGGGIHIKPSHRGRLTDLKKRTGKTEAELYNDGNPAHKKMVVFARNSRKWKHGLGGNLFFEGGDENNPAFTPIANPAIPVVEDDQEAVNWIANWYNNRREQMYNNLKDYDRFQTSVYNTQDQLQGSPIGKTAIDKDFYRKLSNMSNYKTATFEDLKEDNYNLYSEATRRDKNAVGVTSPEGIIYYDDEGASFDTVTKGRYIGFTPEGVHIHERTHSSGEPGFNDDYVGYNVQTTALKNIIKRKKGVEFDDYWDAPTEIYGRMMEFRYNHNMNPHKTYTKEEVQKMLDQENRKIKSDLQRYDIDTLTKALNEVAQVEKPTNIFSHNYTLI